MNKFNKKYSENGFLIEKNYFNKDDVNKITNEIQNLKKNVDLYYDKKGKLRRIERLYDKGESLNLANSKIMDLLKKIFETSFTIFKDKFNAKPPGGEGFFAHYDGIFKFRNEKNELKKGWYEYGNKFVNVLIALDQFDETNGTIEIAKADEGNFDELFLNTKKNGTPDILPEIEKKLKFNPMNLNVGDVVIFNNTCPHRSKKNNSNSDRKSLYYTYTPLELGSKYDEYFNDKLKSKNTTSKSLSGDL